MQTSARDTGALPRYDPAAQFAVEITDVEYRREGEEGWLVRLYRPQGSGPFPLLVDVHGGAWTTNDRTANAVMAEALAASGVLVAALDFRQAPQHRFPASSQDISYAIRWLKAHATEWSASPQRVGILGTSSGGQLALLAAMHPRGERYTTLPLAGDRTPEPTVDYVVACWAIVCPHARYLYAREAGRAELVQRSEGYFGGEEAMLEGSPQGLLDRGEATVLPPTLVVQGTNDSNIPVSIVERFVASYRAAGGNIQLELFEGAPHGFGNLGGEHAERAIATIKAFIARQLA